MKRRARTSILAIVTVVALVIAGVAITRALEDHATSCHVRLSKSRYTLQLDQAEHHERALGQAGT